MTSPRANKAEPAAASPVLGYRAEREWRKVVYLLAAASIAFSLLTMVPAAFHFEHAATPGWAQLVLFTSLVQLAYALWLALVPDWSSLWVAALTLALVATLYAAGLAITALARPGSELLLDLAELIHTHGNKPVLWCLAVMLLASLLAYLAGLASYRWHKAYRLLYSAR